MRNTQTEKDMKHLLTQAAAGVMLFLFPFLVAAGPLSGPVSPESAEPGKSRDTLIVGCDISFPPFSFPDPETGGYMGFDIDVWDLTAKSAGLRYKWQPMEFHSLFPALECGRLDAALGAIPLTSEREKRLDFSHAYTDDGLEFFVVKADRRVTSIKDLAHRRVVVRPGGAAAEFLADTKIFKNPDMRIGGMDFCMEESGLVAELLSGQADAMLVSSLKGRHMMLTEPRLIPSGRRFRIRGLAIALPPGSPLRENVNRALLQVRETGQIERIYIKWFGTPNPVDERP